jgi:hypothetical protein
MIEIKEFRPEISHYFREVESVYTCLIENWDGWIIMTKPSYIEKIAVDSFDERKRKDDRGVVSHVKVDYMECYRNEKVKVSNKKTPKGKGKKIVIKEMKEYPIDNITGLEITIEPRVLSQEEIFSDENLRLMLMMGSRFLLRVWQEETFEKRIGACGAPKIVRRDSRHLVEIRHFPKYQNEILYEELKELNEGSGRLHFKTHLNILNSKAKPEKFYVRSIDDQKSKMEIGSIALEIKRIPAEREY